MTRIGLIEDNIEYRDNLAFFLRREGFNIAFESDGQAIDHTLAQHPCDLILLDLGLPDEDGLDIARRLREKRPSLGIVMLTARGGLDDRLNGMRDGADAYLVKPVDFRELMGVLKSLVRRLDIREQSATWLLQAAKLQLVPPDGSPIKLTGREANLLGHMVRAHPKAASRQTLAESGNSVAGPQELRSIEVALSRLRKKIQETTGQQLILASRSEGYLFGAPIRFNDEAS